MPDPDDILPEQIDFPSEPEQPQLPPENAAPSPTEQVEGLFDTMGDMAQVAAREASLPVEPQIADADVPVSPQAASEATAPQSPQERVEQRAWERGAERKERLGKPIPPSPHERRAGHAEAFEDIGRVAQQESQGVMPPPFAQVEPPLGADFHPEAFADQGFDTQRLEQESQSRDVTNQQFGHELKHHTLLNEAAIEYGRALELLAERLERDRL